MRKTERNGNSCRCRGYYYVTIITNTEARARNSYAKLWVHFLCSESKCLYVSMRTTEKDSERQREKERERLKK